LPAKDYLEHILDRWSDALRSSEDKMEDKYERENEFDGHDEFADTRQVITGVASRGWCFRLGSTGARAGAEEEVSRTAESIHMEPVFKASRKRVYEALTETKQFDKVIHLSAAMKSGMPPERLNRRRSAVKRAARFRSSAGT